MIKKILFVCACMLCAAPSAFGVLQSSDPKDAATGEPSTLVEAVEKKSAPPPPSVAGPKVQVKMRLVPKTPPPAQAVLPAVPASGPKLPAADSDYWSIFKDKNPHAIQPASNSPFVKQVSSQPAGYKRNPILAYGKAKGQSTAGTLTLTPKESESG